MRVLLSWEKVQKRLGELIATERYLPFSVALYKKYLPEIVNLIRRDEVYPYLRDLDTDPDNAKQELETAIDRIILSMQEDHQAFYEAYNILPLFKEWLVEDVFQRTYQDYLTDKRDSITIHAGDLNVPDWANDTAEKVNKPAEKEIEINVNKTKKQPHNEPVREKTKSNEVPEDVIATQEQKQLRINFVITDDNLGTGGQKTKYNWNVDAIRLLNQLEEQNRLATLEEQEILSHYVGWAGIPQVFDEQNSQWAKEYAELKELLDPDEYASARASTLNVHFTSPTIIKAMYTCFANMGFKTGNILEPAI